MSFADEVRATADVMESMLRAGNVAGAIELAANTLPGQVRYTVDYLIDQNIYIPIPRNRTMHLYLGSSESLGRYKVGITTSVSRRVKEINASLTHLAMTPDFTILHFGFGPEQVVRQAERYLLNELKHYSVGGEWFTQDDEVFDTIQAEADRVWEAYDRFLRSFSVIPDINACAPSHRLYAQTQKGQLEHLDRLGKLCWEWVETFREANRIMNGRIDRMQESIRVGEGRAYQQFSLFEEGEL